MKNTSSISHYFYTFLFIISYSGNLRIIFNIDFYSEQKPITMTKEETINYIREYDNFFKDANLENYSDHELMLIKISIDVEKSKPVDYRPVELLT